MTADHTGRAFAVLMAGYPLVWAVGLAPIHYLLVAVPMALWLIRNRPVQVPKGTVFFVLFLLIVGASFVQLNSLGRVAIYALRASWYLAALITFLYLGRHRGLDASRLVIRSMVALWVAVICVGYLAVLTPELAWSTPVLKALPGLLTDNEFIVQLVRPQVSEIQVFRFEGVTLYRPAGPFAYTNAWGSNVALLTPFVLAAFHDHRRVGIPRPLLAVLLLAGLVPFFVALNRGSWLTLGLGLCYGTARYAAMKRNPLPIVMLSAALVLGATGAVATGVFSTAAEQLETRSADSNETRSTLYVETIRQAANSPLIGYGSTRENPANPGGPPLGTHGQFWAVLFAHGFLGAGLFVGFFVIGFFRNRPVEPIPHWAKVSLFIGLIQLPIYGHLPNQLFVMVGALVISGWGPMRPPRFPGSIAAGAEQTPSVAG
ncbi:MAG: O-antigen ligase family protein [Actinomycetota bacterium]